MLHMPHWPKPLGKRPINYNLNNIKALLGKLGNPEKKIPPVLHIAGTNGKGSTLAFIKSILMESGYKVHMYISPHLVYFNERIMLANKYISNVFLHDVLEECRVAADEMNLTFFEGTTAAAFLAFSKIDADIVLLETGMGGRLDATNVIKNPLLSIVTSISLDHQEYLGDSLESIAAEKAGIIKRNSCCIIMEQEDSVRYVLEQCAINECCSVYRQNFDWTCVAENGVMKFKSSGEEIVLPIPSLLGPHQIMNAGTAIAALTVLVRKYHYKIIYEDMVVGMRNTYWPARLEKITSGHLIDLLPNNSVEVFLDGAHNVAGAKALLDWAKNQGKDIHFIIGMTQDRDVKKFLSVLKPVMQSMYCVCVESEPRSQTAESIYLAAVQVGVIAYQCDSLTSAFSKIAKMDISGVVLICGSLFLAGDVMLQNSACSSLN